MADRRQIANSDLSASDDFLGMQTRFNALAEFIRKCDTPMTVAIQGDWGTGKTTAMDNIRRIICGDTDYTLPEGGTLSKEKIEELKRHDLKNAELTVWFDTWQFSVMNENGRLIIDLLEMLRMALEQRLDLLQQCYPEMKEQVKKTRAELLNLGKNLVGTAWKGFLNFTSAGETVSKVIDFIGPGDGKKLETQLCEPMHTNAEMVLLLKKAVRSTVSTLLILTGKDRIYFFVDDLDRLKPEVAVELLECMKNFLDCKGCVFVLAVDQDVIERGLRSKYGADFEKENSRRAAQFFDKIIQVPFELPVDSYKLEGYVEKLLGDSGIEGEPAAFLRIIKTFGEYNPRTIKRSFNLLVLYQLMSPGAQTPVEHRYAFVLLVIRSRNDYKALSRILSHLPDSENVSRTMLSALSGGKNLINQPDIRALLAAFEIEQQAENEDSAEEQTERVRALLRAYREITQALAERQEPEETETAEEMISKLEQNLRDHAAAGVNVADEWKAGSQGDRLLEATNADGAVLLRIRAFTQCVHLTIYKHGMQTADLLHDAEEFFYVMRSGEERQFGYYDNSDSIVLAYLPTYFAGCAVDTLLRNAGILQ